MTGTLQQLHRFGTYSQEHRLPDGVEPLASNGAVMLIRARTIPHTKLADIEAAIKTLCPDYGLAAVISLAVRVAYRAGLRRGEITKLRLCDVEPSPEHTLFIVENYLGPNKTSAARRQIPLATLLVPYKLRPLTQFIRAKRQGGDVSAQLSGWSPAQQEDIRAAIVGDPVCTPETLLCTGGLCLAMHRRARRLNPIFIFGQPCWLPSAAQL